METSALDRITKGLAGEDKRKMREVEASVRECDGILSQIRATREILANPDKTDFDTIKKASEKLNTLKADLTERKKAIQMALMQVPDQDFRDLINFHFQRADK